jgi:hypothetical protein
MGWYGDSITNGWLNIFFPETKKMIIAGSSGREPAA